MSGEVNRPGGEINHENEVKQPGVKEKGGESAGYPLQHSDFAQFLYMRIKKNHELITIIYIVLFFPTDSY